MITWTCYECFSTVYDTDEDNLGYCLKCNALRDGNGTPVDIAMMKDHTRAIQATIDVAGIVSDGTSDGTYRITDAIECRGATTIMNCCIIVDPGMKRDAPAISVVA